MKIIISLTILILFRTAWGSVEFIDSSFNVKNIEKGVEKYNKLILDEYEKNNDRPFFEYKKMINLFKKGGVCNIGMICQCGGDSFTYAIRGDEKRFFEIENKKLKNDQYLYQFPLSPKICYLLAGNLNIIKYLTEKRNANFAEINEKNFVGGNALFAATISGNIDVVNYLLSKGLEIKEPSAIENQTLLHAAAYGGNVEIFKLFISNKNENIKVVDNYGRTVLHHAVRGDSVDMVKYLINSRFDLTKKDKSNQTALEYAKTKKNPSKKIIKLLEQAEKKKK